MKTITRRICACLALVTAAGCGGASGNGRATTIRPADAGSTDASKVPSSRDKTLNSARLKAALITVTDLPTGYKSVPVTPESTSPPNTSADADCAKRYAAIGKVTRTAVGKAEADFEGPSLGTVLQQSLASYKSTDEVKKGIAKLTSLFSDCPSFTSTDKDGKADYTLAPLSFPKLGDQTLAIGITIKTTSIAAAADIVIVRVGRNLQLLVQGGLATDAAALEKAARAGTARLAAASR